MPNINEFIGPKPEPVYKAELERIIGNKPCSKCSENASEAFWDPTKLEMTWTCEAGHNNYYQVK
jgi:hypothetical protein